MINRENIIRDNFTELNKSKMLLSFYLIRESILNAVSELKPKIKRRVLDLGCGIMPYREFLKDGKDLDYIGVDLKPTEYHKSLKPDFYWDGKIIPFEDNSFDFIIATEFLEHYFDTIHILKEICRVLKPGGIFFFTVPNVWPLHEVPYDYHRFTPFSLEEHFKNSKFKTWEIKPLGRSHYHLALSFALWYDYSLPKKYKIFVKPFLNIFVKFLIKKDNKTLNKTRPFENGQMYSGLYGFVTK